MQDQMYVVYCAKLEDKIIYIGSGPFGRQKHCVSGCSHVYALNNLHFKGVVIDVSILRYGLTKEESLSIEKEFIQAYLPIYNKVHNKARNGEPKNRRLSTNTLNKRVCECFTDDQIKEVTTNLDPLSVGPVEVNYSALLKSVTDNVMTVKESGIISYLSEHVTAWNYYIGRVCDLDHIISDKKNLNKYLKELEKQGLIKIEHKGFFYKDSVVIRISPFYVWKGDISLRGNEIRSWYGNGIGE